MAGVMIRLGAPRARRFWAALQVAVLLQVLLMIGVPARPARALFGVGDVVVDIQAIIQRLTQFVATIAQIRAIVRSGEESIAMVRAAYEGMKNWRNLGWIDTLQIVDAPWFDGVEGIDDVRSVVMLTTMSVEGAVNLWADLDEFGKFLSDPRYARDAWFRAKVNSLLRQSRRARALRLAIMRQIQQHNKAITEDQKKIRRIRDAIKAANCEVGSAETFASDTPGLGTLHCEREPDKPVDAAKVASLQGELAALEARSSKEAVMVANQRLLMGLAGEDDAHTEFVRMLRDRRSWQATEATRLREFGLGFSR
jgi:hypothetical protein